jgi:hypothetical protein
MNGRCVNGKKSGRSFRQKSAGNAEQRFYNGRTKGESLFREEGRVEGEKQVLFLPHDRKADRAQGDPGRKNPAAFQTD